VSLKPQFKYTKTKDNLQLMNLFVRQNRNRITSSTKAISIVSFQHLLLTAILYLIMRSSHDLSIVTSPHQFNANINSSNSLPIRFIHWCFEKELLLSYTEKQKKNEL